MDQIENQSNKNILHNSQKQANSIIKNILNSSNEFIGLNKKLSDSLIMNDSSIIHIKQEDQVQDFQVQPNKQSENDYKKQTQNIEQNLQQCNEIIIDQKLIKIIECNQQKIEEVPPSKEKVLLSQQNNSQITEQYNKCNIIMIPTKYQQINDSLDIQKGLKMQQQLNKNKKIKQNFLYNKFNKYIKMQQRLKNFIQNYTVFGKTRLLTPEIRTQINDKSDYYSLDKIQSKMFFFQKESSFLWNKITQIPLINPENKIKIVFNVAIVIYNIIYMYVFSIIIFFGASFGIYEYYLHKFAMIAWISEMVVQMNSAMYHHNQFITNRKIIFQVYMKEYFFFEILPLIFENMKYENLLQKVLFNLPLLLKVKGMLIILENLEFYILQILQKQYILQIFKLIFQMVLLSHILACLWYCVAQFQIYFYQENNTWLNATNCIDQEWWKAYIYAQYWAVHVMMSAGQRIDQTKIEIFFSSICMLFSYIIFGYIINSISVIFLDISKENKQYKHDLNILNQHMKQLNIDLQKFLLQLYLFIYIFRNLKRRANIDLKNYYHQLSRNNQKQKELLFKLSDEIKNQIILQSNKKIVKDFHFFSELFSKGTLNKMCLNMEKLQFKPNQYLFPQQNQDQNDENHHSLYLITEGSDELYNELNITNNSKLKTLTKGQYFGIYQFFTGQKELLNAQSQNFSTVMRISREKFIEILSEEPSDFEKFMQLKDQMQFDQICFQNKSIIDFSCYMCQDKSHFYFNCDKVFLKKKNPYIYFKSLSSIPQKRDPLNQKKIKIKRRKKKRFPTLEEEKQSQTLENIYNQFYQQQNTSEQEFSEGSQSSKNYSRKLDSYNSQKSKQVKKKKSFIINNKQKLKKVENQMNSEESQKLISSQNLKEQNNLIKQSSKKISIISPSLISKEDSSKETFVLQNPNLHRHENHMSIENRFYQFQSYLNNYYTHKYRSQQWQNEEEIWHFEKLKNYKFYFPQYNSDIIIKQKYIYRIRKQNQRRRSKKKKFSDKNKKL